MKRQVFVRELARHLYDSEWHYRWLLATCIHCIDKLPDETPRLIRELLDSCNRKPSLADLVSFLDNSARIRGWFAGATSAPRIRIYNLEPVGEPHLVHPGLPALACGGDLSRWLGLLSDRLDWLADLKRVDAGRPSRLAHYHYSIQPKRRGGNRLIESPKTQLKRVQRRILDHILCRAPVHRAAMGFRKGCSAIDHARLHCDKRYVFCFDLVDYFQSITWLPVWRVFRGLGYSGKTATYLTALCTHSCNPASLSAFDLDKSGKGRLRERHLPQGAPTSPALSNAVMVNLDRRLSALAKRLELSYSRYADDLVLSGNGLRDWDFLAPLVGSICLEEGFSLNHRKTRRLTSNQSQKVAGVVVNTKPNIDRRYYDNLKATLFNCIRSGPDSQNRERHGDFAAHLLGKICYVSSLNREKGRKLLQLYEKIAF